jgi:tetratricopeptide (TPR) repeat protein
MRRLIFMLVLAAGLGSAGPVIADSQPLDALFADLKRERNEKAAGRIAGRITEAWRNSGSASIDLLMQWADEAIRKRDYTVALDFLDSVVTLEPGFAEGWNRRATVHYLREDYAKAMNDIERTLQIEPRHFGALVGMASILKQTGRKQEALAVFERVLDIYPMMRPAQGEVLQLADELAGESA